MVKSGSDVSKGKTPEPDPPVESLLMEIRAAEHICGRSL
ncbi:hypothetical protein B4100_2457 [Heyndrickxia coagulans]|nr:hypothetical protein B4100_2457 [Heyndrickxia coagulans]